MKKLIFAISIAFLASCGGRDVETSGNSYDDIQISMDTVVVDSKDEILMAATGYFRFPVNSDHSKLYYWDGRSANLEIIDLDKLEFVEKKKLETEGPDGVGQNAYQAFMVGDSLLALSDWNQVAIVDLKGNVQQRIKLNEDWIKEGLDEKGSLAVLGFSDDGNLMYCGITNFSRLNSNIVKVDLKNKTTQLLELQEYDKRENFRVTHKAESNGGTSMSMISPNLLFEKNFDNVIFWSDAFNNIYVYDSKTDSLKFEMITSTLTANEKMGTYKNDVASHEAMIEEVEKINLEVSFSKLLWDDKNNVYYRFSSYNLPKIADEKTKGKVFFSIINENFEILAEKEVSDVFQTVPAAQFVKDGLIYCFLNVDDELGYVRIKIN